MHPVPNFQQLTPEIGIALDKLTRKLCEGCTAFERKMEGHSGFYRMIVQLNSAIRQILNLSQEN